MEEERDIDNAPPSFPLKPILVVGGALAGLMLLVCGGAAGYVAITSTAPADGQSDSGVHPPSMPSDRPPGSRDKRKVNFIPVTHDAAAVTKIAATIFKIDPPAGFLPRDAGLEGFVTRAAFSRQSDDVAVLKMAGTDWIMPPGAGDDIPADDPQVRQAVKLVESDYGSQSETTLKVTRLELKTFHREITVLGRKTTFTFKQGKRASDNKPVWKIWGGFDTTNGLAALIMLLPESEFDEEVIVRMLESIRQPDEPDQIPPTG